MQKKIIVLALVVVLTLGIGQGVLAFGPGLGLGGAVGRRACVRGTQAARELEITDEQQQQLSELRLQYLEKTQDLRLTQEKLGVELQALWSADELDAEAIAAKEAESAKVRVKLVEIRRELQSAIEKVYTAEQLEKLKAQPGNQMDCKGDRGRGMRQKRFLGGRGVES
ncbi:MAG: periplasmic heavy metal sensor [Firmicutes bacterium]|nr:periplasmic heavy metal sensor [Bacillota bacterium]